MFNHNIQHVLFAVLASAFLLVPAGSFAQDAGQAAAAAPKAAAEQAAPAAPKAAAEQAAPAAPKAAAEVDFSKLPEPMAFAKAQYAEALKLNAMAVSSERDNKIRAFVDALVDYDDYAKRSMGNRWATVEADKQAEFKALFKELLELTYLKKLSDKAFKENYKIDWDRVSKTKNSATVSCFTKQKDVETELEMVLHAVNDSWEIYDVLVDGASLAKTYQKKYSKKIDEKGVDGIIADMKAEIAKLKKK
ncbi:MAG: ABC transporter substrate-binding protein [Proteobacteria bacterium]|nr:ABC transporter substrate-binding protein [Pseudomonadota bacterium]